MASAVISFAIIAYIGYASAINCPNVGQQIFNPSSRDVVVNRHNELRSMLAHGTVQYKGGNRLRSGKNIYQLSWDCELEKIAQEWANRCQYGHSTREHRKGAGENIYMSFTTGTRQSIDTNMLGATNSWWDEIKKYDASKNPENKMNNGVFSVAGHWSQQAWGATTKIGCGISNCTQGSWKTTFVVCNYLVAGNYMNEPIFEFGNGCSKDSDCTTYERSKCNVKNKLCLTDGQTEGNRGGTSRPTPKPTKPSGSKSHAGAINCPNVGQQIFNPSSRDVVVNRHNELRSMLAHGTVEYKGGNRLRSGKNIYQLSWDCELEKIAQEWANRCQYGHSTREHRKGAGENIYMSFTTGTRQSIDTNMLGATNSWWDEIKKYDASKNPENKMNNGVFSVAGHWSQQAWGATTKIGCGISNCTQGSWKTTFVVCNYLVAGNYMNEPIFEFGNGCSKDSDCTTYERSKCNVNNKLCLTDGQTEGNRGGTSRPTTKPAKPSGSKNCKDRLMNCSQFAGFCSYPAIMTYCPATCRRC